MNLLWFTLLNGMLEWFPTGTMKTFFGEQRGSVSGRGGGPPPPARPGEQALTTSTETPAAGLLKACRDRSSGNMLGSVWGQQLTSRRTRTPLLKAAVRSAVSSAGQYLREGESGSSDRREPCLPAVGEQGCTRSCPSAERVSTLQGHLAPAQTHLGGWLKRVVGKYSITEA